MEYYYICVDDEGNECGFDGNKPQWCDETDGQRTIAGSFLSKQSA